MLFYCGRVMIQILCSYSTLPLYAIVTQVIKLALKCCCSSNLLYTNAVLLFVMKMGSYFKKAIFDEHVQEGLLVWAQKVKKRKGAVKLGNGKSSHGQEDEPRSVELSKQEGQTETAMEEGRSGTSWSESVTENNDLRLVDRIYSESAMRSVYPFI